MIHQRKLRIQNQTTLKTLLHHYQTLPSNKRRFDLRPHGKSAEFDVVATVEEEDFIQIDGSYKLVANTQIFNLGDLEKPVNGLSNAEWARFKFGGFKANEGFDKLAVLDQENDFHLVSFDLSTMQLKKEFKFSGKDFGTPWNISCFDFFDKGNLLVGFDTTERDFCAFNLRKKKKMSIKGN